jgi:FkbM family methyltransferase
MDIGCNMGQSSMLFALGDPDSMICVDPNPKALSRCAENLIFSDLSSKVRFVNAFVSDQENVDIEFYSSLVDAAGSMFKTFAKTSSSLGKVQMVAQHKGDSICDQLDFSPDLVKVDVEGAELKVLNGFAEVSARENTLFFVEVHSGEELSIADNTRNIIEWAENAQYKVYYMKDHSLLRDVDRIKHRGRVHVLLVPQSDQYPDYLRSIPEYGQIELFEEAV